jgi:hypothetical protein
MWATQSNPPPYPLVRVFVTKGKRFRARIKESADEPAYEVSIGGQEWGKGKGSEHKAKIEAQASRILLALEEDYGRFLKGNGKSD